MDRCPIQPPRLHSSINWRRKRRLLCSAISSRMCVSKRSKLLRLISCHNIAIGKSKMHNLGKQHSPNFVFSSWYRKQSLLSRLLLTICFFLLWMEFATAVYYKWYVAENGGGTNKPGWNYFVTPCSSLMGCRTYHERYLIRTLDNLTGTETCVETKSFVWLKAQRIFKRPAGTKTCD